VEINAKLYLNFNSTSNYNQFNKKQSYKLSIFNMERKSYNQGGFQKKTFGGDRRQNNYNQDQPSGGY